jgi:hypothetical protein
MRVFGGLLARKDLVGTLSNTIGSIHSMTTSLERNDRQITAQLKENEQIASE